MLDQLERGRAEHRRDGEEEAELGGGAALDAERQPAHDRRARAADSGIIARHWTMPTPIDRLDRHFGDADDRRLRFASRSMTRIAMPPRIKAMATTIGVAEQRLDLVDQQEAEDRRRQEADEDVADEAPRHGLPRTMPSSTAQKVRQ